MKVIGYVRVSTEEQAREGVSLEAQKHRITAWTEALDGELLFIAEDAGISGKLIRNRDGLRRAMEATCTEQAGLGRLQPLPSLQEHQRHPHGGRQAG